MFGSEGNGDDDDGNNDSDSDNGNSTGGNDKDHRKGKFGSMFENEEAFERMMKRAIEKAVFALQGNKRRHKRGNKERMSRKKVTEKEKYQEDKSERSHFCVSNM